MTTTLPAVGDCILVRTNMPRAPERLAVGVVTSRGRKWVTYGQPGGAWTRRVWPDDIVATLDVVQAEAIRRRLETLAKEHHATVTEADAVWLVATNKIIAKVTLG